MEIRPLFRTFNAVHISRVFYVVVIVRADLNTAAQAPIATWARFHHHVRDGRKEKVLRNKDRCTGLSIGLMMLVSRGHRENVAVGAPRLIGPLGG
jgi:hypothetical protein